MSEPNRLISTEISDLNRYIRMAKRPETLANRAAMLEMVTRFKQDPNFSPHGIRQLKFFLDQCNESEFLD